MERDELIKRARKGKGRGGGNAPPLPADLSDPFTVDEVILIVTRSKKPYLGLMENHAGEVISIRAWEYHAGLRADGAIRDQEFEMLEIDRETEADLLPRVALVPSTYDEYLHAVEHGIPGRVPRRLDPARTDPDPSFRPRLRMTIANP